MDSLNAGDPLSKKGIVSPRIQDLKGRLLRKEGRHRAIAVAGTAEPAGVELDLAAVEVEDRRAREGATGSRSELVAGTVHVKLFPLDLPFRVGQEHAPHSERTETELDGVHHLTSPANRATTMAHAEPAQDDQDVMSLLLVTELLERLLRLDVLTQILRTGLTLAVVVERPRGTDRGEHLVDGFTVRRSELLPPGNGEPSFGVRGKRPRGDALVVGRILELREERLEGCHLLCDSLRLVALGIRVAGADLFVGELVGHRELLDAGDDASLELVTVLDELLQPILVEPGFRQGFVRGVFDEPLVLLPLSIRDGRDRLCRHRQPPVVDVRNRSNAKRIF